MIKKLLTSIITFVFLLASPAAAYAATLSLSPSSGTFNKGCSFNVDVVLDAAGVQTDGTDALITYLPSSLTTDSASITNGTIYGDYPGNNVDSQAGLITISGLASVSSAFSGKGVLATIRFKVNDNAAPGATAMTFRFDPNDKTKTTDSNVVERGTIVDVLNSVVDGNYTIGTGSCNAVSNPGNGGGQGAIGSGSAKPTKAPNLDQIVGDKTGTEELTFTIAIIGITLTIIGILGLAIL